MKPRLPTPAQQRVITAAVTLGVVAPGSLGYRCSSVKAAHAAGWLEPYGEALPGAFKPTPSGRRAEAAGREKEKQP